MIIEKLNTLRDYIKTSNPYFTNGYSLVYQDQGVWYGEDEKKAVFPSDIDGNYFYFRLPNNVTLTNDDSYKIGNCVNAVQAQANIILVAFVKDADGDLLATNLINTLQTRNGVSFQSAIISKETVVRQELSFLSVTEIQAALQRIPKNTAIVSVNFLFTVPIAINNCIVNPCKEC